MIDAELNKARKLWGEELLLERESCIQKQNVKIAELEYQVFTLEGKARQLAQQNALFREKYPRTAYAAEITELKAALDHTNERFKDNESLNMFRIESNNQLRQQLDNAEDYINELYRLNPNLELPNGKRLESDFEA